MRHRGQPHVHWGCQYLSYFLETIPSEGSSPSYKAFWHIGVTFRLFSPPFLLIILSWNPEWSAIHGQKRHRPLGILQHNSKLVRRNFINLRTVGVCLTCFLPCLYLTLPPSTSDFLCVLHIILSHLGLCSLIMSLLFIVVLPTSLFFPLVIPIHSWPPTSIFSSLIFVSRRKLSSLTLTPSYSPFLRSFPSLPCGLFSFPCTSLPCKLSALLLISAWQNVFHKLWMSLEPQEP